MLALLPDWVWHILTISGVVAVLAAWFLKHVPFVAQYSLILKIAGTVAVLFGIWMEGGITNEAKWQAKVADMEAKVKVAEAKSESANDNVRTVVKEKIKVVHDVQVVVKERIVKDSAKIDADCRIDPEAIDILNQAAGKKQ